MALARIKTWIAGEVLTAADQNTEFNNILNNPMSLISPFTAACDIDGYTLTLDSAGVTQVVSSAAVSWNFTSGAKSGTPATTGSVANWSAQTFTDSATAGSGTATAYVAYAVQRPTLAATNASVTTTDAATYYIPNAPAAGTNETITNPWALWIDAGNVRFDDDIHWLSGQTFAQRGIFAHANTDVRTYTFPDSSGNVGIAGVAAGNVIQVDQTVNATTRAATTTLGTSLNHTLSDSSTTITAFNGVAGVTYHCRTLGAGQITHHSTDLIITQSGVNIVNTAAGDTFDVEMITTTTCRLKNYVKADGYAIADDNSVCDFRLTLTTALPVTTADVTGATTIYCTPYSGNRIALYDGSRWNIRTSAEFSLALGTLTSGLPYDVFCYDNAGTPTLEFLAWTNDTTRATALTLQDGVLVKTGATTRRYLGTFYTTATTTTEDSFAKRFLWNYYNRVARPMKVVEATTSWTYTTATFRQARATATNQLDCVIGVAEVMVSARVHASTSSDATRDIAVGVGVDSTSVNSAQVFGGVTVNSVPETEVTCFYTGYPAAGRHYFAWLERSETGGTTTWIGTLANGSGVNGIMGELMG